LTRQEREIRKWLEEKRRWHERRQQRAAGATGAHSGKGIVAGVNAGICEVDGKRVRTRGFSVVVGDEVLYSVRGVERVLPRRTELARAGHVIAANIDVVVIVASFLSPPLRPGLIDRYLVAVRRGGCEPLLCVNKCDRKTAPEVELLAPYEALVPVVLCSALTGEGLDTLRDRLRGRVCVFSGHSGVGKSSLVNALAPGLELKTGTVIEATSKGRHTTSASSLADIGDGIRVIDTPGIREFAIEPVTAHEFPEFERFAPFCRFRDCTHTHELECAVRQGVAGGVIPRARYEAYVKLAEIL
jgi:ribosome biogenesis GTPase